MRYMTAGESHGPRLLAIVEGMPSHLTVDVQKIDEALARRQKGYGRGKRMMIEQDRIEILSGVRHGYTTGAPITLSVMNRDFQSWEKVMSVYPPDDPEAGQRRRTRPRPGHADLSGAIKYGHRDVRDVLERSSARETAMRVAAGALAKQLLEAVGIDVVSHVRALGGIVSTVSVDMLSPQEIMGRSEASPVRVLDPDAEARIIEKIDAAKSGGDTLGGVVEVIAYGVPVGLGSHVQWDRKLDANIAQALMSIQAIKGVAFGDGFELASRLGSEAHDPIYYEAGRGYYRKTNRAGGFEGGMTTGMPIVVQAAMKPIPTLYSPLPSVDLLTKEAGGASVERSDVTAVPAAAVVAEFVLAFELARALLETFPADRIEQLVHYVEEHRRYTERF
ncbi:MAG: chorismate synthase [Candidatus Carbobacillus altaicus]|nr:chorismate synthase [Candidatus Carbobacillus altaicus]